MTFTLPLLVLHHQEKGWEPIAVLNWLAQAGRGPMRSSNDSVGDRDKVVVGGLEAFSLPQLIEQVSSVVCIGV